MLTRVASALVVALLALGGQAFAQSTILQGGPYADGRAPMYVGAGSGQAILQDSGPAGGGGNGVGLAELLLQARGPGLPPYAGLGTGPLGANHCETDGPITSAAGYHYLCFSANANGGGLIEYGALGGAPALPFLFNINGVNYTIGGTIAGIAPGTTLVAPSTPGGVLFDNAGVLGDSKTLPSGLTAPSLTVTTAFTATGLVTNADLANPATTVNGQTCTLGSSCSVTSALIPGTTTIAPSTSGGILSDNAGVLADSKTLPSGLTIPSATLTAPSLGVATATSINGVTIGASGGALSIASGKTLTDTSGVGADLLLGATGGGFTAYGGASSAGNVLLGLSAAGAGSFQPYGLTGASTLVETTSGGLITASLLPAATTSILGAVSTDGATIANASGAISCRTATSSLLGCASFGTGLSVTAGAVTPTFGTATNQVAEGGVITGAGPIGSATAVPVITYNAAGQLTAVSTAALGTAAADNTGTSGATIPLNNGGFTQSGAALFSSTLAESNSALPSVVAGQLGLAGGNTTSPTLGANDEGDAYLQTVNGLTLIGKGSTYDAVLLDSAGAVALGVQTGTLNLTFGGGVTAASLATPSSNIGGALCATTGGTFLYNVGANCYAGGGTAGGSNTQVQWNTSGSLGGITGVTSNGTTMTFANAALLLAGSSSGSSTLEAPASGGGVATLPAGTVTIAGLSTAQTFSAAQTFSSTLAESNSALPSVVAGQLGLAGGNTTSPTLGANDEGDAYLQTVNGLTLIGKGSTYDAVLLDSAGAVALGVQTGTLNLTFGGGVTAASLATPSSNIGGALCATTGGTFLYNVGANCYAGGGVTSVFTRTGAVVATAGDYTTAQLTTSTSASNPSSGQLGYTVSNTGSTTNLTTSAANYATLTSLPAGDYFCWGSFIYTSPTIGHTITMFVSATSATDPGFPNGGSYAQVVAPTGSNSGMISSGGLVVRLASAANVYAEAYSSATADSPTIQAFLSCQVTN